MGYWRQIRAMFLVYNKIQLDIRLVVEFGTSMLLSKKFSIFGVESNTEILF